MYKEIRDFKTGLHTIHVLRSETRPELIAARIQHFNMYHDEFVEVTLNHEGLRRGYDLLLRRDSMRYLINLSTPKRGEGRKVDLRANITQREVKVWIPESYLNDVNRNVKEYGRTIRGLNVIFK